MTKFQPLATSGKYSHVLAINAGHCPRIVATYDGKNGWDRAVAMAKHFNASTVKAA